MLRDVSKEIEHYERMTEAELRQEYRTPAPLFESLDAMVGGFTLDAAADDFNHLCLNYCSQQRDGLKESWNGERVFCNPPFKLGGKFVAKAFQSVVYGGCLLAVILIKVSMCGWFWRYAARGHIGFFQRRVEYVAPPGIGTSRCAFDSMLVVFEPGGLVEDPGDLRVSLLNEYGGVILALPEWEAA